jgi:hypothetical protein
MNLFIYNYRERYIHMYILQRETDRHKKTNSDTCTPSDAGNQPCQIYVRVYIHVQYTCTKAQRIKCLRRDAQVLHQRQREYVGKRSNEKQITSAK